MNAEIKAAQAAGLSVLYCIGERSEEQEAWREVLGEQLDIGLEGVDMSRVVIAYEPVWSIGPGKTPADKPYIEKIARFVKERTGGLPVVYGGGLKKDNAQMLASIAEIDGGLIALTRFTGEIGFYPDEYIEIIRSIGRLVCAGRVRNADRVQHELKPRVQGREALLVSKGLGSAGAPKGGNRNPPWPSCPGVWGTEFPSRFSAGGRRTLAILRFTDTMTEA